MGVSDMSEVEKREVQKNRIVEKLIKLADKIIYYQGKQQEKRQANSQSYHTDQ